MTEKTTEPLSPIRQLEEQIRSTAPTDDHLSLPEGDDLEGLKYLNEGFAISLAYDRAFALGFPYCYCTGGLSISEEEAKVVSRGYYYNPWRVPAPVARRICRMIMTQGVQATPTPGVLKYSPESEEAATAGQKLVRAEFEAGVVALFKKPGWVQDLVALGFLAECDLSPFDVADALTNALIGSNPELLSSAAQSHSSLIYRLGLLLLRCSEHEAADVRSRIDRWLTNQDSLFPEGRSTQRSRTERASILRAADLSLGGREVTERSGWRVDGRVDSADTFLVHDSPAFVRDSFAHRQPPGISVMDARLVFLGGEEVLEAMVPYLNKLKVPERPKYMETFGVIKSPLIVEWLKKNKKLPIAKQLLELHGA